MSKMNTETLKLELEKTIQTIIQAQEALLIVRYLSIEDTDPDKQHEKSKNSFYFYSRIMFWRLSVIELSKLFLDRETEKYNLNKFLNKISKGGIYSRLRISQEKISEWKSRIDSQREDIENLKIQRDKAYVHIDSDSDSSVNTISYFRAQELLIIAQEIIKDIYRTCFETEYVFQLLDSPAKNLESCIERLSRVRKMELFEIRELEKSYGLKD